MKRSKSQPSQNALRLVVVSPGDVRSERETLPVLIDELNRSLAFVLGLRLELWRWETDAYPGFHIEGPQGLIDEIMRIEDSDIVIGIFWKRFGTPVTDAESGTQHELRRAWEAWRQHKRPQVMVYFNQEPYSATSKTETDQWGLVLEFQKTLPKEAFWWPYQGKEEFQKLVRDHLTHLLIQHYYQPNKSAHHPTSQEATTAPSASKIKVGFLDGVRAKHWMQASSWDSSRTRQVTSLYIPLRLENPDPERNVTLYDIEVLDTATRTKLEPPKIAEIKVGEENLWAYQACDLALVGVFNSGQTEISRASIIDTAIMIQEDEVHRSRYELQVKFKDNYGHRYSVTRTIVVNDFSSWKDETTEWRT